MVSDNTRSELNARLLFVENQREILSQEMDTLRQHILDLCDEERYLKGLKDVWSKN